MQQKPEKVVCNTPTPGKAATRIDKWKYDAMRNAILHCVPEHPPGIAFKDLPDAVSAILPRETRELVGSITWYCTCVKLDMETKGELFRVADVKPQHLVRQKPR